MERAGRDRGPVRQGGKAVEIDKRCKEGHEEIAVTL